MSDHIHIDAPRRGKKDKFLRSRSVILSPKKLKSFSRSSFCSDFYITDIGFYPNARKHVRIRERGCRENILIYCIDGSGVIQLEDTTHPLESNTYFIIPAFNKHKYWASEKTPWSIYWVHFGSEKNHFLDRFYGRVFRIDQSTAARINDRLKSFNEILTALESGLSFEIIHYANLCLCGLLASFFYVETFRIAKGIKKSGPVDEAIAYMQSKIDKQITIDELAKHVQLSKSHFTKVFRNRTGTSPLDFFINLKMQEAIRLLAHHHLSVKETAFQLGYRDQCYFSRIFTKQIGSNPSNYSMRED